MVMKAIVTLLSIITIVNSCNILYSESSEIDSTDIKLFKKYQNKFYKKYDFDEYNYHLKNFASNNRQIINHNNYNMDNWKLGWTNLTDKSLSDVKLNYTVFKSNKPKYYKYDKSSINDIPMNIDWRESNTTIMPSNHNFTNNIIYINPNDENSMLHAISKGPVHAYISIDSDFMNYNEGIYNSSYCNMNLEKHNIELNHKILIMGYGNFKGILYYIIKNDWDTTWGLNGYGLLNRWNHNICGIMNNAFIEV
jgi:hypothetical protein